MDRQEFLNYFRTLDRAQFIGKKLHSMADYDGPLPIGYGQTISQPSLVAQMTIALDPQPDSRVLEIGTGSGYQTALLAPFCQNVYSVERIPELATAARKLLDQLGFTNIEYRIGDGSLGWAQKAPFDRILVAAAAGSVPPALIEQLSPGGRLIIPVGPRGMQDLMVIEKDDNDKISRKTISYVSFVELVGPYGW